MYVLEKFEKLKKISSIFYYFLTYLLIVDVETDSWVGFCSPSKVKVSNKGCRSIFALKVKIGRDNVRT